MLDELYVRNIFKRKVYGHDVPIIEQIWCDYSETMFCFTK